MSPVSLVIGLWLSAACSLSVDPQAAPPSPTLIELARQHPGSETQTLACGPQPTFDGVVGEATVVVHGSIVEADARLSPDQREVWTDYHVQPIQVLRERPSSPLSLPIVVTARGGTVVVEGLTIRHSFAHNGVRVTLQVGDEAVLLGTTYDNRLVLDPFGVFMVSDGEVKSNGELPGFSVDQQPVRLEAFVERVRESHR